MRYDEKQPALCPEVYLLPLERISPRDSLHYAAQESPALPELAASIRQQGLLRPVTVRRCGSGRYVIVSGNRRLLACRLLGMSHIDALILPAEAEPPPPAQLLDQLLSGRLHYLEAADALHALHSQGGFSLEALSAALMLPPQRLAQRMRLHALPPMVRTMLAQSGAPERIAMALLRLPQGEAQLHIAGRILREQLCVRDAELLVTSALRRIGSGDAASPRPARRVINLTRDHRPYINAIRAIAGQMQEAGVSAVFSQRQVGSGTELVVTLPGRRRRTARHSS